MKKIISVLLAVFLLVSVLPLAVSAEEGEFKTVLINENGDYLRTQACSPRVVPRSRS